MQRVSLDLQKRLEQFCYSVVRSHVTPDYDDMHLGWNFPSSESVKIFAARFLNAIYHAEHYVLWLRQQRVVQSYCLRWNIKCTPDTHPDCDVWDFCNVSKLLRQAYRQKEQYIRYSDYADLDIDNLLEYAMIEDNKKRKRQS